MGHYALWWSGTHTTAKRLCTTFRSEMPFKLSKNDFSIHMHEKTVTLTKCVQNTHKAHFFWLRGFEKKKEFRWVSFRAIERKRNYYWHLITTNFLFHFPQYIETHGKASDSENCIKYWIHQLFCIDQHMSSASVDGHCVT